MLTFVLQTGQSNRPQRGLGMLSIRKRMTHFLQVSPVGCQVEFSISNVDQIVRWRTYGLWRARRLGKWFCDAHAADEDAPFWLNSNGI
jgi:hypothetical protein